MSDATARSSALPMTAKALSPAALVAIGGLVSVIVSWPTVQEIWRTGTFFDTDDAMRMVQVRAWISGQSWFDLTAYRLDPPIGVPMHWSRIVDVPLAFLIRFFMLFFDQDHAELLTRLVFPMALQLALIAATVFAATMLAGPQAALPALVLVVTNGFQFGQFVPGRIDHHAPQITLLMLTTAFAVDVVLRARVRSAMLAALCIASSVAISLENLPFIAIVVAGILVAWVCQGSKQAKALGAFGVAIVLFTAAVFGATIAPARYLNVATDALSLPHLLMTTLGGVALVTLAQQARWLDTAPRRIAALGVAGSLVAICVVSLCPGVLISPYAAIDPVVQSVWLAHVTEALPLPMVLRLHPQAVTLILCPMLAGLVAAGVAATREQGARRIAWALIAVLVAVGAVGTCWEVRVIASVTPLAVLGGIWVFDALQSATRWRPGWLAPAVACLLLAAFSPWAWNIIPVSDEADAVSISSANAAQCRQASNVAPLARLSPGVIFAPIDSGSHILVHTAMSVIGAPYHRNNAGNRLVIDGFSANPDEAEAIVKGTGARYVALCAGQTQAAILASRNPQGLAAQLLAGRVPPWLDPVALPHTQYQVYTVR